MWLLGGVEGGACMVARCGVRGCPEGACMVDLGGGPCVVARGGVVALGGICG